MAIDELLTAEPVRENSTLDNVLQSLGSLLVQNRLVAPVAIDYALHKQKIEGGPLGLLLVELGFLSSKDLARQLALQRGIDYRDVDRLPYIDPQAASSFNRNLCLTHGFLPVAYEDDALRVLLGNAIPDEVAALVQRRLGIRVLFWQGEFQAVARAIHQYYYFAENPVDKLIEGEIRRLQADVDRAYSPARLLDLILHLAVRERATDVHFAPTAKSRTVLLRVDGVLRSMFALSPLLDRLVAYIKLQANMEASEHRLPQDGSFTAEVMASAWTIRVSTLISEFGERMVLRLLPERSDLDKLTDLGFLQEDVERMERIFSRPHGLLLITGPTGSGKSTTLHAALRMQQLVERNVLTVEDPVEYRVPVACQTEVNRRAGYEFASAMRHFLRHDPDIMLIGEIRDAETARAALDAASTGHLVLSTLHVGSIFGVVPRLRLLGVDAETVAENLVAIINQRLVRRICPHCSRERPTTAAERQWLQSDVASVRQGVGCGHCSGSGYFGRLPVYELLIVQRELADAIAAEAPRSELRRLVEAGGMRLILSQARQRVLAGESTLEEMQRAVGLE